MVNEKFTINGYDFFFTCNSRYHRFDGVVVSYPPSQLDDPKFIEALRIALGMYQHVDAACTLAELIVYADPSPEVYVDLYDKAVSCKDFDLRPVIEEALQERSRRRGQYQRVESAAKKRRENGFVYLLQSPTGAYKIGKSKNPKHRSKTFGVQLPFEVEFIALIQSETMSELEAELHQQFADKRINGEWFNLTPEDVEYIKGLVQ